LKFVKIALIKNYFTFENATMYAGFFAVFMVNVLVILYIISVVRDPENFASKKPEELKKE